MKFNHLANTFSAGEWSPKMRARSDAEEHGKACETLINFIPKIQGGAFRRPGTVRTVLSAESESDMQNAVSNTAVKSKMIPFVMGNGNRNILCAFDTQPSTTWFLFSASSPTGSGSAPTPGTGANFTVSAASLKYAQYGDYIFLVENSTGVGTPARVWYDNGFGGGGLKTVDTIPDLVASTFKCVPYMPINALGINVNLTPSAATGAITLTASATFFAPGHVGAYFKLSAAGSTAALKVTGYTSDTVVSATVVFGNAAVTAHGAAAGTSWEESAWSDYRGWPRTVCTYQGRVIFGGNKTSPSTLWGSRIGNSLDYMERPVEQDDDFTGYLNDNSRPFTLTPSTGNTGPIKSLTAGKSLLILTEMGEITGMGTNGALGPNDVNFESSSSFGCGTPMPARVGQSLVFVQKGGRKIRDLVFNMDENAYKSQDLMFVADHLSIDTEANAVDKIVEIIGVQSDSSFIYAKTQNGRLLALTIDYDYKINAWSQIVLGGKSELKTFPLVKSMCAIPDSNTSYDRMYLMVQRYSDGASRVSIEYFDIPKETSTFSVGPAFSAEHVYVDMKMTYNAGAPTTNVVTGLAYLEGEKLQVVADGFFVGEKTVDSAGNFVVDNAASFFVFGYKFPSLLKTMPIELGAQVPGTPQGFIKRIDEVMLKFYLTYGAKYGHKATELTDIGFKDPNGIMNQPPVFFTGMKLMKMPSNYEREAQVIVSTDKPWPCNILAIISKGILYD